MKIIILLLVISFLSFNAPVNAQCNLSNERKQEIIDSLNSSNYWHRTDALEIIWHCKIIEAKEIIEERFWEIGPEYMLLNTLYDLGSDLTYQFALAFYDTLQNEIDQLDLVNDPDSVNWERKHVMLEYQVSTIEVLSELNDFSKAAKVIELLDSYPEEPKSPEALSALEYMINGTPQYRERAITEFENALQSDAYSGWDRLSFLYILRENLGQETFPIAYTIFLQDTDQAVRRSVLSMLPSYTSEDVPGLLKERLLVEPDQSIAGSIIGSLLYHYGTPSTYNYMNEFAQSNPDPEFSRDMLVSLKLFESYRPDSTMQVNLIQMLDTLQSYSQQCLTYNWIDNVLQTEISSEIQNAKTYLSIRDSINCANEIKVIGEKIDFEYKDTFNTTTEFVTREGWQFLYNISQNILDRLPEPSVNPNLLVTLTNSQGAQIPASSVMYYESSWKDAVNNGDGTFTVITTKPTVSIRVYYEYASQQEDNVTAQNNTYTFQTVNAAVQLKNSSRNLIDQGTIQFYAGAWRGFGTTSNGVVTKELLPINYSFRMTYEYGSVDKQQNLSTDPVVVFQTVNAAVQLKNSSGSLIDQGTVQYYAGAWRSFGTTSNGVVTKELLPVNYSFRMTYEYGSLDKQQNLSTDPTVVFQTVNAAVQLKNNSGNLIDQGTVQYYTGAWRSFGTTSNGVATKELLPINYSFRMTYEYISKDKQQNIGTDPIINFSTVLCTIKVIDSQAQPINNADVKYYAGAWRNIGSTTNGEVTKELLPANITFRATSGTVQQDKTQNISVNSLVEIILNTGE